MHRNVISFPLHGEGSDKIIEQLNRLRSGDASWRNGRMFGYIYHPGNREAKAIEQAYLLFLNENALNPSLFSSLRRLENETVAMVADLLFHVDSCLGGMILPFIESLGYEVPPFDFRVRGVTSISADVHKYGYSAKGASVILYHSHELRKFQYFVMSSWPGGLYASPTMLGTRSGAPIAGAWAALKTIGRDGYMKMAEAVMKTTHFIQEGIESAPGLKVIGKPEMSVFSFTSDRHDIYRIGDELSKRGWNLDKLQFPSALHMTVSFDNTGHEGEFLEALKESVSAVEGQKIKTVSSHVLASVVKTLSRFLPEKWFRKLSARFTALMNRDQGGGAATGAVAYGMMVAIDNRENVDEIMLDVLDKLYTV